MSCLEMIQSLAMLEFCKTFLLSFIGPVVDYFSGISHSLLSV